MNEEIGEIKGTLKQMNERLNHVETDLRSKAGKWEIRIWSIVIIAVVSAWSYLIMGT
jgi:hypothetical protein